MRTRNAFLVAFIAQIGAVGVLAAQKPAAKPTTDAQKSMAKNTAAKPAPAPPAVSSDSAHKVLMANVSGAAIKHERLHRKAQRLVYDFTYTAAADKAEHHATVDAKTGEFHATADAGKNPTAAASKSKSSAAPAKKPGK